MTAASAAGAYQSGVLTEQEEVDGQWLECDVHHTQECEQLIDLEPASKGAPCCATQVSVVSHNLCAD